MTRYSNSYKLYYPVHSSIVISLGFEQMEWTCPRSREGSMKNTSAWEITLEIHFEVPRLQTFKSIKFE